MYRVLIVEDDPMVAMINEQYVKKNKQFTVVYGFACGARLVSPHRAGDLAGGTCASANRTAGIIGNICSGSCRAIGRFAPSYGHAFPAAWPSIRRQRVDCAQNEKSEAASGGNKASP